LALVLGLHIGPRAENVKFLAREASDGGGRGKGPDLCHVLVVGHQLDQLFVCIARPQHQIALGLRGAPQGPTVVRGTQRSLRSVAWRLDVDHCWDAAILADIGASLLLLVVESCGVAHLGKQNFFGLSVLENGEALRIGGDGGHVVVPYHLGHGRTLARCQPRYSLVAVEAVVALDLASLLDDAESVAIHLDVELELELEEALVFTVDGNRALVLALARIRRVAVDCTVRNTEHSRLGRLAKIVRHEEELVGAEVKLADVLDPLHLADLKAVEGLLLGFVVEPVELKHLSPSNLHVLCDLGRVHLTNVAGRGSH
jgi:hypothetical protein